MKNRILWATIGVILAIATCIFLFWGTLSFLRSLSNFAVPVTTGHNPAPMPSSMVTPFSSTIAAPSLPSAPTMPTGVIRDDHGTTLFLAHAEDLIRCYNHRWGSAYLRPLDTWRSYVDTTTPCAGSAAIRYSFLAEDSLHSWPAIDIYCADGDTRILEISLSLSEHDWSENYESIFQKQSTCMLSVFYPQLSETKIADLYGILRQEAKANEYISPSAVPAPLNVHVLDGVGCWGYTYSGMIRINIIPVNQAFLTALSAKGVAITDIHEVTNANKN